MAKALQTRYGKIKKLGWNPRNISDPAFTKLCESLRRDKDFMVARGIVIDENNEILGGNQRYAALQLIHEELQGQKLDDADWIEIQDGRIPDKWVVQVTGWTDNQKKRFNLIDNSPAGIAGEFDYEMIKQEFGIDVLENCGIDFSEIEGMDGLEEFNATAEEKAEQSDLGSQSEAVQDFAEYKQAKQDVADALEESNDIAHHVDFVFQSYEQKMDFLKKAGLECRYGLFGDGKALAEKMGIALLPDPSSKVLTIRRPEERLKKIALPLPEGSEDGVKEVLEKTKEVSAKPKNPKKDGDGDKGEKGGKQAKKK